MDSEKFNIPDKIKRIRFDIGLSYCAPNSAIWLTENKDDLLVLGVEPNKYCLSQILNIGIYCSQKNISPFMPENFWIADYALDNVDSPTKKTFYYTESDPGTSSLLKPTKFLGNNIKETGEVLCIPFYDLLSKIDYDRFDFIELVKIDTQGKDLDIIKSAKNLLEKIVFLNCEINTFNHYEDNTKPVEIEEYLNDNNFVKILDNSFVNGQVVDATFINKKFYHLKDKINYYVL